VTLLGTSVGFNVALVTGPDIVVEPLTTVESPPLSGPGLLPPLNQFDIASKLL
jgi:hypothetical protein